MKKMMAVNDMAIRSQPTIIEDIANELEEMAQSGEKNLRRPLNRLAMRLHESAKILNDIESVDTLVTDDMVNRFLGWPLPESVCVDLCAAELRCRHKRSGTNLLNFTEAREMLEYVLGTGQPT